MPNHRKRSWLRRLTAKAGIAGGSTKQQLQGLGGNINIAKNGLLEDVQGMDDAQDIGDDIDEDGANDSQDDENADPVPAAQWPISIRDEDGNFEEVIHPGHKAKGHPDVTMMVPRF